MEFDLTHRSLRTVSMVKEQGKIVCKLTAVRGYHLKKKIKVLKALLKAAHLELGKEPPLDGSGNKPTQLELADSLIT